MHNSIAEIIRKLSWKQLLYFIAVAAGLIIFYVFSRPEQAQYLFDSYLKTAFLLVFGILLLFIFFIAVSLSFKKDAATAVSYASLIFLPYLLIPAVPQAITPPFYYIIAVILVTQGIFFFSLKYQEVILRQKVLYTKVFLTIAVLFYFAVFTYLAIKRLGTFSLFNPRDFAIFNQTLWNTVQGRFYLNSTDGSLFACHNSLFFLLIVPFYAVWPGPATLIILKTVLLSASVIPFYLIAKKILNAVAAIPLTLAFMFYPFIVSQHFTPPHEITYAPFFILCAYYFFHNKRFAPFLAFAFLCLSIKEHIAFLIFMFGIIALFKKRSLKWILLPCITAVIWFVLSLAIIYHAKHVFQPSQITNWILTDAVKRLSPGQGGIMHAAVYFIKTSNIGNVSVFSQVSTLFSASGLIFPFLGLSSLLGLPELLINAACSLPGVFSIPYHYNIVVSCFILTGSAQGIRKIAFSKFAGRFAPDAELRMWLLSVFVLFCVLLNVYQWNWLMRYSKDAIHIRTIKEALAIIPSGASVTVPRELAVHVSQRREYSVLGIDGKQYKEFIVTDDKSVSGGPIHIVNNYIPVFNKDGITVFRKVHSGSAGACDSSRG